MIHEKWFVSDTHFFHENIIRFCGRPFANAEIMNENLVKNWNSVVGKNDFVYHLGDVFIGGSERDQNELLYSLNGHKRLIVGNHDKLKSKVLQNGFDKIDLWKGFKEGDFTAVHIPLRLNNLRDGGFCVHGHIHTNLEEDIHYINVCVEHRNYTPVHLDQILLEIKNAKHKLASH
jgi:calcineurin-like phosphoesterase family protein